jgi:CheY-like chemotaxis protein
MPRIVGTRELSAESRGRPSNDEEAALNRFYRIFPCSITEPCACVTFELVAHLNREGGGWLETSRVRVLVVDDFETFRRFVCSTLSKNPELQIVGEASDGLEAVHKAEELQPDLIVLDLGLPTMNGIEAARQIRKLAPASKILFLSQESSADVVQEALTSGARAYVLKARARTDLLAAVEAVLEGRQFVSSGLQITPGSV